MKGINETKNTYVPVVVTREADGNTTHQDIYSRLLKDRIIMIDGEIEPHMASIVVAELLYLQSEDSAAPINLYISSPGGVISAGLSIIDTMNLVTCPVHVTVHGMVASMASVIAACGDKGHRYILPNAKVMLHQASSGNEGNVQDMRVAMAETERINTRIIQLLAKNCGKDESQVRSDTERDNWMDAEAAVKYGLIDEILYRK